MRRMNWQDLRGFSLAKMGRKLRDGITDGWYFPGDPMSQDRRRLVMCNYTSNIIANFVGGVFWSGLLLCLNADDAFIGTLSIISSAANMLQCFAPLLLERFPKRRRLLTIMRGVMYLINVLFIGLIPMFPGPRQVKLYMTGIGVLLANVINAVSAPGISIWHVQSLPEKVMKSYFALITMTVGAVVAVCNLLGSALMDFFTTRGMNYYGLLTLRGIALILCAVEMYLYFHIREYPYESAVDKFSFRDLLVKPFAEKKYLLTVAVTFLWNVTANIPGSYYSVYLLRDVGMSYTTITVTSMINVPVVLLLTPLWRRILGKFDWFKTLYVSMSMYLVHYGLLALVTKTTLWVYPISQLWAFFFAIGINLSFTGIPYVNMPTQNRTVYIGFYSTFAYLAVLVGVTIGKYFILATEGFEMTLGSLLVTNKQLIVLLTGGLMIFAVLGIRWVDKCVHREKAQEKAA